MSDINIKFQSDTDSSGGDTSSNRYLIDVLNKLNGAIERLSNISTRAAVTSGGSSSGSSPFGNTSQSFNNAVNEYNKAQGQAATKFATTFASTIGAGFGYALTKYVTTQTTAILGRATSIGSFGAATIAGNANNSFGSYAGSFYSIERQRQLGNTSALYGGAGIAAGSGLGSLLSKSLAGGAAGATLGGAVGLATPIPGAAEVGAGGGFLAGAAKVLLPAALAYVGDKMGDYFAASTGITPKIEAQYRVRGALAERQANASVSEWKTGFSRFGLATSPTTIVPGNITGSNAINVPLSQAFESRYGKSQNYNGILNGIVPNLASNPLDSRKTGDLDKVAQNFLKAGFAVQDFGQLTTMSSQYIAAGGKNIQAFSEDLKQARARFGDSFTMGTEQSALNLMAIGYGQKQAQNIAFQSQFNPGMAANVARFNTQGVGDYYRNQALSSSMGMDINASLQSGTFVGSGATKAQLIKELKNYQAGKGYGQLMTVLNAGGQFNPQSLQSLVESGVATNNKVPAGALNSGLSPAQQIGAQTLQNVNFGDISTGSMAVQAGTVILSASAIKGMSGGRSNEGGSYSAPMPYGGGHSPTK